MTRVLLTLVAFSFVIQACSDPQTETHTSPVISSSTKATVAETFEVGRNVVVRAIDVDQASNTLWVGTSVGALHIDLASGDMLNTFTRENGLANEYVFAAKVDQFGEPWFGTNGGGVSWHHQNKWKTFFPMHGLADYWVYSFAEQSNGDMWIGTWAGLNHYSRKTGKLTTYLKELVNEWVYGLDVDSRGRLWIGTEGGVNMFDGTDWAVWTREDGLGAPNESALTFSTNTGLGTRDRHDLSVLQAGKETYNPNYVFCIEIDNKDQIWAGTWGGGVSRYDGKKWQNFTMAEGLAGNIVYSASLAEDGALWFGTDKGVSRFDGSDWQSYGVSDGLLDSHVYAVATAGSDVWVGTRHGVVKLKQ